MSGWRDRQVRDLGKIITGRTPSTKRKDFYGGDYSLISPADLDNGKYVRTAHKRLTKLGFEQCSPLPRNTVLVGCIGNVGKLGMVNNEKSATNQQINALICNSKNDPEFVYYCFLKNRDMLKERAVKTTVPILNKTNFGSIRLKVPPLYEQKKIAHILSTVQRAIETQARLIQTTTELKKVLMHKLFTEGLHNEPQKQTEIGPIPESWATPTLESVCNIKASAMSYKELEVAPNISNGTRVVGVKVSDMNLPGNEIEFCSANLERRLSGEKGLKRTVPENSIVFPKRGAAIATNKKRLTICPTVLDPNLIAVMPSDAMNHRYLFHWFETFDLRMITDPGPTPQLNKKNIAPLKFPMPTVEEQEAIVDYINVVEDRVTLHKQKKVQLQDLSRTLLHELMTSKIRVF